MHLIDWLVVGAYLVWIVWDGLRRTEGSDQLEGYFLANRSLPWWAVGLSVMATQLSAITLVGATGQGYADGMRFVQFYLGLPIAMIILSLTLVPFFYRARVYTAYEYLEKRFDVKTRTLASALFLLSRGMSCGVIIAAPAVILSIVLGWNLTLTILAIGLPTVLYTMHGGVQAVTWTDVKQMAVIILGVGAAVIALIIGLPDEISFVRALRVAGAAGRLNAIDFRFDWNQTYTFWSGLLGGLFLMLSYFGCDQSQVQRYLTAKSIDEGRSSLLMSAYWKIPLQALVLLTGVLVFVFYLFNQPPMLFNRAHAERVEKSGRGAEFQQLESRFSQAFENRRSAASVLAAANSDEQRAAAREAFVTANSALKGVRGEAAAIVRDVAGDESYGRLMGDTPVPDVNYVFPTFVTTRLPIGLVGLIIAAIFAAAMSSIAAELNSLATSTVIDMYRRHFRPSESDQHYLRVSKAATLFWGIFACIVATFAAGLGSLIEVVNRFGSFFYGSLLGVFVLALGFRRCNGHGAFAGLAVGIAVVAIVASHPATKGISFLWHNPIGVIAVVITGVVVSELTRPGARGSGLGAGGWGLGAGKDEEEIRSPRGGGRCRAGAPDCAPGIGSNAALRPGHHRRHAGRRNRGCATACGRRSQGRKNRRDRNVRGVRGTREYRCHRTGGRARFHRRAHARGRCGGAAARAEFRTDGRDVDRGRQLRRIRARCGRGAGKDRRDEGSGEFRDPCRSQHRAQCGPRS